MDITIAATKKCTIATMEAGVLYHPSEDTSIVYCRDHQHVVIIDQDKSRPIIVPLAGCVGSYPMTRCPSDMEVKLKNADS
jgi:hypothetical protein